MVSPETNTERVAFSIQEFCFRNAISPSTYFKLKRAGLGPNEMRVGNLVRITFEAELEWQRARTHPIGVEAEENLRAAAAAVARGQKAGAFSCSFPSPRQQESTSMNSAKTGSKCIGRNSIPLSRLVFVFRC